MVAAAPTPSESFRSRDEDNPPPRALAVTPEGPPEAQPVTPATPLDAPLESSPLHGSYPMLGAALIERVADTRGRARCWCRTDAAAPERGQQRWHARKSARRAPCRARDKVSCRGHRVGRLAWTQNIQAIATQARVLVHANGSKGDGRNTFATVVVRRRTAIHLTSTVGHWTRGTASSMGCRVGWSVRRIPRGNP
eukprot:scaffold200269_cov32-Tisochrysis_lutea.AAC.6